MYSGYDMYGHEGYGNPVIYSNGHPSFGTVPVGECRRFAAAVHSAENSGFNGESGPVTNIIYGDPRFVLAPKPSEMSNGFAEEQIMIFHSQTDDGMQNMFSHQQQVHPSMIQLERPMPLRMRCDTCDTGMMPQLMNQPGAVTSLSVNQSASGARLTPELPRSGQMSSKAATAVDQCMRCRVNPSRVTVTGTKDSSVLNLCAKCHTSYREERTEERTTSSGRWNEPSVAEIRHAVPSINQNGRTVIKVDDKKAARASPSMNNCPQRTGSGRAACSRQTAAVIGCSTKEAESTPSVLKLSGQKIVNEPLKLGEENRTRISQSMARQDSPQPAMVQSLSGEKATAAAAQNIEILVDSISIYSDTLLNATAKANRSQRSRAAAMPLTPAQSLRGSRSVPPAQSRLREYVVAPAAASAQAQPNAPEPDTVSLSASRQLAFNPNYDPNSDTASIMDLGLPEATPRPLIPAATTKEEEANRAQHTAPAERGGAMGGVMYPTLSAPPRYEEVVGETTEEGRMVPGGGAQCVSKFGKYGDVSTMPGAFKNPRTIDVSHNGKVVVVDSAHGTVQTFSGARGECLSLIKVPGVNGSCMLNDGSIAAATSKGVEVYSVNGKLVKRVGMGPVGNVVRYRTGFVAVRPKDLVVFRDMGEGRSHTLANMSTMGGQQQQRQAIPFKSISDVAVNSQHDFVVLDSGSIYTLSEEGYVKSAIHPSRQPCGALRQPTAITVDRSHNIIVSDSGNGRVLLFGANGQYQRTLYESRNPASAGPVGGQAPRPAGLASANQNDHLFVVTKGPRFAEVAVLTYG